MSKTLYSLVAIERSKSLGDAANILPGDVFDSPETEANRLLGLNDAVRVATDEDVALAKVRNRHFPIEAPAETLSEAAVNRVKTAVTNAKGEKPKGDGALV